MLVNMKTMLAVANQHNFAVPAFNTTTPMIMQGILEVSEEINAPVILQTTPDEFNFFRPSFVTALLEEACCASVPVCIHFDHGANFDQIIKAIQRGYTSVMIDASSCPFEENVSATREVCRIAHAVDVSVEGELGTIGTTRQDLTSSSSTPIEFTTPEEAEDFIQQTDIDALAIAIGTSHGIYPHGLKPHLQLSLLKEIKEKVGIPLVLHGGSSNRDEEIAEAAHNGINKINLSGDLKDAFYQKCREVLQDPYIREPAEIYPLCIEALKEVVRHKFDLLGTAGKAELY